MWRPTGLFWFLIPLAQDLRCITFQSIFHIMSDVGNSPVRWNPLRISAWDWGRIYRAQMGNNRASVQSNRHGQVKTHTHTLAPLCTPMIIAYIPCTKNGQILTSIAQDGRGSGLVRKALFGLGWRCIVYLAYHILLTKCPHRAWITGIVESPGDSIVWSPFFCWGVMFDQ